MCPGEAESRVQRGRAGCANQMRCQDQWRQADHKKQGRRLVKFSDFLLAGEASNTMYLVSRELSTFAIAAELFIRQQQLGADQTVTKSPPKCFLQPSFTSWCALKIISTLLKCWNSLTTRPPNSQPAPREFFCQVSMSSGSDHMRSQRGPEEGISTLRWMERMRSMVAILGERPPCTQKCEPSMMAARGRQSKVSLKQYQGLQLPYFFPISSQKPYMQVMFLDSWLPLSKTSRSGCLSLYRNRRVIVSTELQPRSTKSPIIMQRLLPMLPPFWNISSMSKNCPWTSPQTVTGACTGCTLDSSNRSPFTLLHSVLMVASGRILQALTVSMQASMFIFYIRIINSSKFHSIIDWIQNTDHSCGIGGNFRFGTAFPIPGRGGMALPFIPPGAKGISGGIDGCR